VISFFSTSGIPGESSNPVEETPARFRQSSPFPKPNDFDLIRWILIVKPEQLRDRFSAAIWTPRVHYGRNRRAKRIIGTIASLYPSSDSSLAAAARNRLLPARYFHPRFNIASRGSAELSTPEQPIEIDRPRWRDDKNLHLMRKVPAVADSPINY